MLTAQNGQQGERCTQPRTPYMWSQLRDFSVDDKITNACGLQRLLQKGLRGWTYDRYKQP
jgi:hypothetical protein